LIHYVPNNAYLIWTDDNGRNQLDGFIAKGTLLQFSSPYQPYFKLGPSLIGRVSSLQKMDEKVAVTIQMYNHEGKGVTESLVQSLATNQIVTWSPILKFQNAEITLRIGDIQILVNQPDVLWVEERFPVQISDEVQGQIVAGNLSASKTSPSGPGYKAWLD